MITVFISGINKGLGSALAKKFLVAGDFVIGIGDSADFTPNGQFWFKGNKFPW